LLGLTAGGCTLLYSAYRYNFYTESNKERSSKRTEAENRKDQKQIQDKRSSSSEDKQQNKSSKRNRNSQSKKSRDLIFVRHASAEVPDAPSDMKRPLDDVGREQTQFITKFFRSEYKKTPDLVLSSPSARTSQTILPVISRLGWGGRNHAKDFAVWDPSLYKSSKSYILQKIQKTPKNVRSVVIVGHNPEFQATVNELVNREEGGSNWLGFLKKDKVKLKKGCVAWFKVDGDWKDADYSLEKIVCPPKQKKKKNH